MSQVISTELLRQFDIPGPRYTSYPTADRFVEAFGASQYVQALASRRAGPLSLYVHIPFCQSVCYYCACNKVVTKNTDRAQAYLHRLGIELALHMQHLGPGHRVSQLHLGGGSPTFFSDAQLQDLMGLIQQHLTLEPGGEYAIEVDPRTVNAQRLQTLAQLGFNRLSFGVQDFDPAVQKAVHRVQPPEQVLALMQAARHAGFASINIDLIYGLPLQTPASFARTLAQVQTLQPDRIALYAYAHLPARFKPQRRIHAEQLPSSHDKLAILHASQQTLLNAGYVHIGMDHFALPQDPLAIAKRQGRLHRNFQGYSTQPDCDLLALGVSAIARIGPTYSQNAKTLQEYDDAIDQGRLPIARGIALTRDDLLRRCIIMSLMCQGHLQYQAIEIAHLIDFKSYFARELQTLASMAQSGLLQLDHTGLQITPTGWFVVRAIAMVFDKNLQTDLDRARFSKII